MRKFLFILLSLLFINLQLSAGEIDSKWIVSQNPDMPWRLYKTSNMWNYLQLNTATGIIFLLQFDIEGNNRGIVNIINEDPLVNDDAYIHGRFTLYPTDNIYTFILLDQINGNSWQVQWSFESEKCFIIPLQILDDSSDETSDEALDKPSDSIEE